MSKRDHNWWSKSSVMEVASLFSTIKDFRKTYVGAYAYAKKYGFLEEATYHMNLSTDPTELLEQMTRDLGASRRHFMTAKNCRNLGDPSNPNLDETPEDQRGVGNYLDHDISHWEQCGEEAEDRALRRMYGLNLHGSPEQIAQGWSMFEQHQLWGRQGMAPRNSSGTSMNQDGKGE